MSTVVTGATGQLGRLAVEDLGLGRSELFTESGDLSRLNTSLATAVADALR